MSYAIEHEGQAYTPEGKASIQDVQEYNSQLEQAEIAWLKTGPEKVFLYVKAAGHQRIGFARQGERNQSFGPYAIQTFLGTNVATDVHVGREVWNNFDFWTHKRSVTCRIFGVRYVGWFYESSGDYCRLRRAKAAYYVHTGKRERKFRTLDEAREFCGKVFERTKVVLSIVER